MDVGNQIESRSLFLSCFCSSSSYYFIFLPLILLSYQIKLAQSFDPVHEHLQKTDHGTMETCREGMSVEDSLILKLVNYYRVYE